jgi:hypothetical protein
MGQFSWFWPVWSENQKQQREDAKKNQISDTGFWKSVLRRFHAPKKIRTKCLRRWDRTTKVSLLRGWHSDWSQEQKAAHTAVVWGCEKFCAQLLEATGQERKIGAPDTHAWRTGWAGASKKNCARPAEKWPDREKINFCMHSCWPDSPKKNYWRALTRSDQTEKVARRPCWAAANRQKQKKVIWPAQQRKWPDSACTHLLTGPGKKSQAQTLLSDSKQKKNNLTRPAEEVTGQGEKKQKNSCMRSSCWPDSTKKNLCAQTRSDWTEKVARDREKNVPLTDLRPVKREKDAACPSRMWPVKKNPARLTLLQLTDLREQACADRPGRDRFNRSTIPVQPVLTRMVLVKTG